MDYPLNFNAAGKQMLFSQAHERLESLVKYLKASPTAWHATKEAERRLKEAGFEEAQFSDLKDLKTGDKYFYKKNSSALFAVSVGADAETAPWKLYGAHTDSPALKIKPHAAVKSENVYKLNTEVYGGPILNTWFDRPLSLAGRVFLEGSSCMQPQEVLVDFKRPILILPNAAIHMNREVNDGVKIERQKVLMPFLCSDKLFDPEKYFADLFETDDFSEKKKDFCIFKALLAKELPCAYDEILDFELITYETAEPQICGLSGEFVSAGRLDNLASSEIGIESIIKASKNPESFTGVDILILTDNEEVGSGSKQGADSSIVRDFCEVVAEGLKYDKSGFFDLLDRSFMISSDLAHAVHPNYPEFADPTHRPPINGGPVIKVSASQSYASDAKSQSVFASLCKKAGVPYSYFVNRSDMRGGSTIGPITSRSIPLSTVDVGNPIWGMHSVRETGGVLDHYYMSEVIDLFMGS